MRCSRTAGLALPRSGQHRERFAIRVKIPLLVGIYRLGEVVVSRLYEVFSKRKKPPATEWAKAALGRFAEGSAIRQSHMQRGFERLRRHCSANRCVRFCGSVHT